MTICETIKKQRLGSVKRILREANDGIFLFNPELGSLWKEKKKKKMSRMCSYMNFILNATRGRVNKDGINNGWSNLGSSKCKEDKKQWEKEK